MQVPRQVGIAFGLNALFLNIGDPLRVESKPVERIRLENAEGDQRGESAGDEAGDNE